MFNKGDKVRRTGVSQCSVMEGGIYTINKCDGIVVTLEEDKTGTQYYSERFELVKPKYPNDPHPHAELIKAWADGADIEVSAGDDLWLFCEKPKWSPRILYRIKPEVPEVSKRDLEIQDIQDQMESLQQRMDSLKDNQ